MKYRLIFGLVIGCAVLKANSLDDLAHVKRRGKQTSQTYKKVEVQSELSSKQLQQKKICDGLTLFSEILQLFLKELPVLMNLEINRSLDTAELSKALESRAGALQEQPFEGEAPLQLVKFMLKAFALYATCGLSGIAAAAVEGVNALSGAQEALVDDNLVLAGKSLDAVHAISSQKLLAEIRQGHESSHVSGNDSVKALE